MLYKFLESNKPEILSLAEDRTLKLAGLLPSSSELKRGLPVFLDYLIMHLKAADKNSSEKMIVGGATDHGKELLRLNYSLSHVVHAYGAMCQAVTELAQRKQVIITPQEFNDFNLCLDIAISAAVSEFQFRNSRATQDREVQHLGILAHELRNALSSVTVAFDMIKQGIVGSTGATSKVLDENLTRMRLLIDRSLSEVRMKADPKIVLESFDLGLLIDQILLTAQSEAESKRQRLTNEVATGISVESDRQLLLSALANLVQNALKYSKVEGLIQVRAGMAGPNVIIEIEDSCGGLQPDVEKNLFKPFVSCTFDQSGLGLGLTIVQRAVHLLQGSIRVHNNPGRGCAFLLEIPLKLEPAPLNRPASGIMSAQPKHDE